MTNDLLLTFKKQILTCDNSIKRSLFRDIVMQKLFKHDIEKFNLSDNYYYAQFLIKRNENKNVSKRFLNKPSHFLLVQILNHLIYLNIHEQFSLGEMAQYYGSEAKRKLSQGKKLLINIII